MGNGESVVPLIRDYRDLDVFKKSRALVKSVYELTSHFPPTEKFGLSSQLQRAVVSIPSNIAEGNARSSRKEYAHFISISAGSSAELETLLILAGDLNYVPAAELDQLLAEIMSIRQMLNRLRKNLAA